MTSGINKMKMGAFHKMFVTAELVLMLCTPTITVPTTIPSAGQLKEDVSTSVYEAVTAVSQQSPDQDTVHMDQDISTISDGISKYETSDPRTSQYSSITTNPSTLETVIATINTTTIDATTHNGTYTFDTTISPSITSTTIGTMSSTSFSNSSSVSPGTSSTTDPSSTSTEKPVVYGKAGCHDKCTCPDRHGMALILVPFLRQFLGEAADQFSDQVLLVFLEGEFQKDPEDAASALNRLKRWLAEGGKHNALLLLFHAAMYGTTVCDIPAGESFVLNASIEPLLFPQAVQLHSDETGGDNTNTSAASTLCTEDGQELPERTFPPAELYNISFTCAEGDKLFIMPDVSLTRYGRWQQYKCDVITDGELRIKGNMSLVDFTIGRTTALWLWNITKSSDCSSRASTTAKPPEHNTTGAVYHEEFLRQSTIFPHIGSVTIINTSLSLPELSDVLSWFQDARSLSLIDNRLSDFQCHHLLPSPAAWPTLKMTRNGLRELPACLLRTSLVDLSLSDNAISNITTIQFPRFVPSRLLEVLDLSNNDITDVGILSDMPKLSILSLAGNKITSLHKLSFNRLPELGLLDLSRNMLHVLEPGTFKTLLWLLQLDLRHNSLEVFDRSVSPICVFGKTSKIKVFLNHNRFSHPPFQKDGYDSDCFTVYAGDNPYECDCDMETYVDFVNTDNSTQDEFVDRTDMLCRFPSALAGRRADSLRFTDVCPVVDGCPTNCSCGLSRNKDLVTVECVDFSASQFPARMPAEYDLQVNIHSKLVDNPVRFVDADYLRQVMSLNVSGVGLTSVPDLICEAMPRARMMDLSHNKLSQIPECLKTRADHLPALELYLAHNPWSCDCDNVWMRDWLADTLDTKEGQRPRVRVVDAGEVWCSADTEPGTLVARWDTGDCYPFNYLPLVVTLGVVLGLALILTPVLYVFRLKALVTLHATLHVRPFTAARHFVEADYDHEALIVHGDDERSLLWMTGTLLPRMQKTRHRLCVPERDFFLGASIADSYAEAVTRSKAVICLLNHVTVQEEWWLYAFQIARAQNARRPQCRLLLVLLEHVQQEDMPEEVRNFIKTNTYLSADDKWFWKKLLYYLPDPLRE